MIPPCATSASTRMEWPLSSQTRSPAEDSAADLGFRKLTALARALTYATTREEILALAAERAAELVGASAAAVAIADGPDRVLLQVCRDGVLQAPEEVEQRLDESFSRRLRMRLGPSTSVPLVSRGKVVGLLAVEGEEVRPETEWFLGALADQLAVASDRVPVHAEARRRLGAPPEEGPENTFDRLAHDLRSPIHSIHVNAELLASEGLGPLNDAQRTVVTRLQASVGYLLSLAESLRALQRAPAGVQDLSLREIHLPEVVARSVVIVSPEAEERSQRVRVEHRAPLELAVRADPEALSRVLVNVLFNAIRHSPPGGEITVRIDAPGPAVPATAADELYATVAVSDQGPGIPPEELERIFEPRYSSRRAPEAPEGSGLGLTIARELVVAMGGRIRVESEPGRGATFNVDLRIA